MVKKLRKLSKMERLYQKFLFWSSRYVDEHMLLAAIIFLSAAMWFFFLSGGK